MVQLVRWYVGMFHAGRPSEVAKKPYNPIIGETFKCYWNVPGIETKAVSLYSQVVFRNFHFNLIGISHMVAVSVKYFKS